MILWIQNNLQALSSAGKHAQLLIISEQQWGKTDLCQGKPWRIGRKDLMLLDAGKHRYLGFAVVMWIVGPAIPRYKEI